MADKTPNKATEQAPVPTDSKTGEKLGPNPGGFMKLTTKEQVARDEAIRDNVAALPADDQAEVKAVVAADAMRKTGRVIVRTAGGDRVIEVAPGDSLILSGELTEVEHR